MPEIDNKDFPSNSNSKKQLAVAESAIAPKKVEKIVTGQVVKKRNSLGNSITQTLFGNDARSVISYVLHDVLIPAAKSTLSEMVSGGIEMLLFGDSQSRNRSSRMDRGRTYVSYGKFYKDREGRNDRVISRNDTPFRSIARSKYEDVVLETRGEAEEVVSNLIELIEQYDVATIADFYDLVGVDGDFSDNKYGWTNLSRATVSRVREGYIINFPKPRPIE